MFYNNLQPLKHPFLSTGQQNLYIDQVLWVDDYDSASKYLDQVSNQEGYKNELNYFQADLNFKIGDETEHAVRIDKFSDSSIDLYVRCFTVTNEWSEWLKVKERLAVEVKKIVEGNGASFAFPSTSIYVEKK